MSKSIASAESKLPVPPPPLPAANVPRGNLAESIIPLLVKSTLSSRMSPIILTPESEVSNFLTLL